MTVLAGGACHTPADDNVSPTYVYRCEDGYRFVAQFEPQRVWLFMPDRTLSLPEVPSASGMYYTDGAVTLRGRGSEARLETAARTYAGCASVPAEAEWEDAKLRGIEFRAAGAGWILEITHRQIVFAADGRRMAMPAPAPQPDPRRGITVYDAAADDRRIRIVLQSRTCRIERTGEIFDTTVTITFTEKIYEGCGTFLRPP